MPSLALIAIRLGDRLPLPRKAKSHLERCAAIELLDSVFDPTVMRPTLAQVLGLVPLHRRVARLQDVEGIGVEGRYGAGSVRPDGLSPHVFNGAYGHDGVAHTLH